MSSETITVTKATASRMSVSAPNHLLITCTGSREGKYSDCQPAAECSATLVSADPHQTAEERLYEGKPKTIQRTEHLVKYQCDLWHVLPQKNGAKEAEEGLF